MSGGARRHNDPTHRYKNARYGKARDGVATIVEGDAFAYLSERREPIDFVFLDA